MKIGNNYLAILGVTTVTTVMSCSPTKKEYTSFELYSYGKPYRDGIYAVGNQIFPLVTNSRRGAPDAL